ncbi:hypothetical protein GEMRC1_004161 [Eukaryota sp. GEM-RC1]
MLTSYFFLVLVLSTIVTPAVGFIFTRDNLCGFEPAHVSSQISGSDINFYLHPCKAANSTPDCTSPACMQVGDQFINIGSREAQFQQVRQDLFLVLDDGDTCQIDGEISDRYQTVFIFKCDKTLEKGKQIVKPASDFPSKLCTPGATTSFYFEWSINDPELCSALEPTGFGIITIIFIFGLGCASCFSLCSTSFSCLQQHLVSDADNTTKFLWALPFILSLILILTYPLYGISLLIVMLPTYIIYKIMHKESNINRWTRMFWLVVIGVAPLMFFGQGLLYLFEVLDYHIDWSDVVFHIASAFFTAFLVASLTEEILKLFIIHKHSDSAEYKAAGIASGAFYGAASGFGFAFIENVLYVFSGAAAGGPVGMVVMGFIRVLPMTSHIFYAWFMGLVYATNLNKATNPIALKWAFIVPFICHGMWNFSLMVGPAVEILFGAAVAEIYSVIVFIILVVFLICFGLYVKNRIKFYEDSINRPVGLLCTV